MYIMYKVYVAHSQMVLQSCCYILQYQYWYLVVDIDKVQGIPIEAIDDSSVGLYTMPSSAVLL